MFDVHTNLKNVRKSSFRIFILILISLLLASTFATEAEAKSQSSPDDKSASSEEKKKEEEEGKEPEEKPDDDEDSDGAEPKPKEDDSDGPAECNPELLSNFRLEGLTEGQEGTQMELCKDVGPANNCCSVIDEIKIIKSWNAFSKPKLDKFADDMTLNYKKVYSFDSFIKQMDVKKGRYHYSEYKWSRIAEEKCYNGKYFISRTGIDKLSKGTDWFEMKNKQAANFILNHIVEELDSSGILDRLNINKLIQIPLKDNKEFEDMFKHVRPGFSFDYEIKEIEDYLLTHITSSAGGKMKTTDKKKEETLDDYLTGKLEIGSTLSGYLSEEFKFKNWEIMQKAVAKEAYNALTPAITEYLKEVDQEAITEEVLADLETIPSFMKSLEFMFVPQHLNQEVAMQAIENDMVKAVTDVVVRSKDVKGMNYHALVDILKDLKSKLNVKDKLKANMGSATFYLTNYELISGGFDKIIKDTKDATAKAELLDKLAVAMRDFDDSVAKDDSTDVGDELKFVDKENDYVKAAEKHGKALVAEAKVKVEGLNGAIKSSAKKVLTHLDTMLKDIPKPIDQKTTVCAMIYHSNLYKQTKFNESKLNYCRAAEEDFKMHTVDVSETLAIIDVLKPQLRSVLELKRGFYCEMCNKASNAFIDVTKKRISLSQGFCFDVVSQFKDYLSWKNITFMKYVLKVYQYLKCFSDDGTPVPMPFKFFAKEHEEAVPQTESCMGITKPDEVGNCLDLCDEFDYIHYSAAFDGERQFIVKLINMMLDVVRLHGFVYKPPQEQPAVPTDANQPGEEGAEPGAANSGAAGAKKEGEAAEGEGEEGELTPEQQQEQEQQQQEQQQQEQQQQEAARKLKTKKRKGYRQRSDRFKKIRKRKRIHRRVLQAKNLYEDEIKTLKRINKGKKDDLPSGRFLSTDEQKEEGEQKEEEGEQKEEGEEGAKKEGQETQEGAAANKKGGELPPPGENKEEKKEDTPEQEYPMIYKLFEKVTKGEYKEYTREKYFEFNESKHSYITYNVTKPNIDFNEFLYVIKEAGGLEVMKTFHNSNFDIAVAELLIGKINSTHEDLEKNFVKVIINTQPIEIDLFNTELEIKVEEEPPVNPEREKRKAEAEKLLQEEEAKAQAAIPQTEEGAAAGEGAEGGEGGEGAEGAEEGAEGGEGGEGAEEPRKLYGKLYKKYYSHHKNNKMWKKRTKRSSSNPFMKAVIDMIF
jgi:hypothetical protein